MSLFHCPINARILLEQTREKVISIESSNPKIRQEVQELDTRLKLMDVEYISDDSITGRIASIVFTPNKKRTRICLEGIKKRYWIFGKLPKFKEGDKVDLEFEILLIKSHKQLWVTMIRLHEMKKDV